MRALLTVLVIDDDAELCEVIHAILIDEGYQCLIASSPTEALNLMPHTPIDLILLDLKMAENGHTFLKAYRATPAPHVPIILISGVSHVEEVAATMGVQGYLRKPFDLYAVLDVVAQYTPKT